MKVVLRKDYPSLGKSGEIKNVKDGYAQNFLIPKMVAYPATESYLKIFENEKISNEKRSERIKKESEDLKVKIEGLSLNISVKTGEEDRLFGSVTAQDIIEKMKENGINLSKKQLVLEENIKKLGIYHIPVKIAPDIEAQVKVWIIKE